MSKKKDKTPKSVNKKESYSPSMLKTYRDVVVPNMVSRFNYENSMQVPRLLSIALNMGLGDAKTNSKKLESAIREMALITCLLYTSPSPRDATLSRMPSSA